ncbi:MAG: GNAT family N-acetyltransferase [Rhodospirillales bacterium]|nr:GNAT family N-acetyltransferase [Rhodospirillales bacterium]MCW8862662.1 GNAT family N-acetyltransferase [Rhodospirillales bacterium]MCW8951231.1 GNAT family N-acetyltransferase [Rhodospirillales bacterium]MCW9002386.1 GNAT family N-acetyltransferase [Rhodospirillales bacterium]
MTKPQENHIAAAPSIDIREAREADMPTIQAIYAHYVENTAASFEEKAPEIAEMKQRRAAIAAQGMPYLVAEVDGEILGFAYAGPFRARSAYRYTVEDSIYVPPGAVGKGIGSVLMSALVDRCTELGFRRMVAVIGDSENTRSIKLHTKHGFKPAGVLPSHGFKFGRWVDAVLMQRPLGEGDDTLPSR